MPVMPAGRLRFLHGGWSADGKRGAADIKILTCQDAQGLTQRSTSSCEVRSLRRASSLRELFLTAVFGKATICIFHNMEYTSYCGRTKENKGIVYDFVRKNGVLHLHFGKKLI